MQNAIALLLGLNGSDIKWIFDSGHEKQAASDTIIIQEGSHPENLYIVLSGLVGVQVSVFGDSRLATLGPGELLGEISFMERAPASGTVTALESTLLLALPKAVLEEKLSKDDAFAARLYRSLALIGYRRLREEVGALGRRLRERPGEEAPVGDRWRRISGPLDELKSLLQKADQEAIRNEGVVPEGIAREMHAKFMEFVVFLNDEIGEGSPESAHVKSELGGRVQREILPYVLLTRSCERMYSKPRGYAGDYLTIEWIYRNEPGGSGRLGPLLDRLVLDLPAAHAVRNRRALLAEEILGLVSAKAGEPARVTSLACGPARELFDVLERLDDSSLLEATLVDIDLQALAYVSDQLDKRALRRRVNLMQGNLVYLATGRQRLELGEQDLIYSIGLIDYFEDQFVIQLMNYVHDLLRPGGKVILGNFHVEDPCRAFIDYVLDWQIVRRTEDDMNQLYSASKFGRPCTKIRFEDAGINLFAECHKGGS